ncbi:MAG: L-glutamate gamma-semialdehyde dehydrogenase, partial [Verrucomicrobia bacterium]|nr:L-glutamate gamma-semialdehyde dehydrogenase [Verrucomicrobiota bacterium]
MNTLQDAILANGGEIFARMHGQAPSVFSRKNLIGRLLNWSMANEAVKTQLFRFIDVLPSLRSSSEVTEHACTYLGTCSGGLPVPVRGVVRLSRIFPWLTAFAARQSVVRLAHQFILAPTAAEAIPVLRRMRQLPLAFTVDVLGETAVSENEADHYQARYFDLIDALADEAETWPRLEQIDTDDRGAIPKVNLSV